MTNSDKYRIQPLEEYHAKLITLWRYQGIYTFYNPSEDISSDSYLVQFLNPNLRFHAVIESSDDLVGFCSFGVDGQVLGGNYEEEALDIGLGMKPELTGQGKGSVFFQSILSFSEAFNPVRHRLTVASFNKRAMSLYKKFGFTVVDEFDDLYDVSYTILMRSC